MGVPDFSAGLGGTGSIGLDAGGRPPLPWLPTCTDVIVQVLDADVSSFLQNSAASADRRGALFLDVRVIAVLKERFEPSDFKKSVNGVASQDEAETRTGFEWPGVAKIGQDYKVAFWRNLGDMNSVLAGKTYEPEYEASGAVKDPWVKTCFPFLGAVVKGGLNPRENWESAEQLESAVKFAGFPLMTRHSIPPEAQAGYQYDTEGYVLIPMPTTNGKVVSYRQPDTQAAKAYWRGQVFGIKDMIHTNKGNGKCFPLHNYYFVDARRQDVVEAAEQYTGMAPRNFTNAIFFGEE